MILFTYALFSLINLSFSSANKKHITSGFLPNHFLSPVGGGLYIRWYTLHINCWSTTLSDCTWSSIRWLLWWLLWCWGFHFYWFWLSNCCRSYRFCINLTSHCLWTSRWISWSVWHLLIYILKYKLKNKNAK